MVGALAVGAALTGCSASDQPSNGAVVTVGGSSSATATATSGSSEPATTGSSAAPDKAGSGQSSNSSNSNGSNGSNNSGSAKVLGPDGLGALKLGMTEDQATATGLATVQGEAVSQCSNAVLVGQPTNTSPAENFVMISPNLGVAIISVSDPAVRTPEGIGLGSTLDQVKAAYPASTSAFNDPSFQDQRRTNIQVPGSSQGAVYRVQASGNTVDSLSLQLSNQDCTE